MAIDISYLNILKQVIDLKKNETSGRINALCLSYPDLLVPKQAMIDLFTEKAVNKLVIRTDSEEIWAWHNLKGCQDPLYDTSSLFELLGIDVEIIDIVSARGDERIVDLNEPLPIDLHRKFDLVIDTGTCEHCFNVGQAFKNSCEAVALDGYLIHAAPINRCNHGFWNFCPTVYPDFFEDNGFQIIGMTGIVGSLVEGMKTFDIKPFDRAVLPSEAIIYVIAKRTILQELRWPMQRKYRS